MIGLRIVLATVSPMALLVAVALIWPDRPATGRPLEPPDRRRRSRFGLAA